MMGRSSSTSRFCKCCSPIDSSVSGVDGRSCLIWTSGGLFSGSRSAAALNGGCVTLLGAKATLGWKDRSKCSLSECRTTRSGFCSSGGSWLRYGIGAGGPPDAAIAAAT